MELLAIRQNISEGMKRADRFSGVDINLPLERKSGLSALFFVRIYMVFDYEVA